MPKTLFAYTAPNDNYLELSVEGNEIRLTVRTGSIVLPREQVFELSSALRRSLICEAI